MRKKSEIFTLCCLVLLLTFAFLVLIIPNTASAAPSPYFIPSRTSGVAPLAVFFDTASSTGPHTTDDAVTSRPFHDLEYSWDFDDPTAGVWTYGTASTSKNAAYGPEAAHVFETPGTYTVTMTAFNGTDTVATTTTVTVTDPEVVFSGTNTVCIANSLPTAGVGGCPSGATTVASSDFDASFNANAGTGKRLLYNRGDTFDASASAIINDDGPMTIGAYGTGAKPIVNRTGGSIAIQTGTSVLVDLNDYRIMDLDITGGGNTSYIGIGQGDAGPGGSIHQLLILRVTGRSMHRPFEFNEEILLCWNGDTCSPSANPNHTMFSENAIVESDTSSITGGGGGYSANPTGIKIAVMGNRFDNSNGGTHVVRNYSAYKQVMSHNMLQGGASGGYHILKLLGPSHSGADDKVPSSLYPDTNTAATDYMVISDNKFSGGLSAWTVSIGPQDTINDERVRNLIVERNWFVASAAQQIALETSASTSTFRNNLFDLTGAAEATGIWLQHRGIEPVPTGDEFYNNSFYSSSIGSGFVAIDVTDGSGHFARNNLAYAPNATGPAMFGSTVGTTRSNNSTDFEVNNTSPDFVNTTGTFSTPSDFDIPSGSYATDGGTTVPVWSDFLGTTRPQNALYDMGAFEYVDEGPDVTAPTILSVDSDKGNGAYTVDEVIDIDVTFSEAVTSTGEVTVTLETGTPDRTCTFTLSNASTGTCTYTVQAGDTSADLTASSISGTIADQADNPMTDFAPATNLAANKALVIDTTAPTLSETTPVPTPATDTTPSYTFTTDEAGDITYGGDCTSGTASASGGPNNITFSALSIATHGNCTITVTDAASNPSTPLSVTSFSITDPPTTGGGSGGGGSSSRKKTATTTTTTATSTGSANDAQIAELLKLIELLKAQLAALLAQQAQSEPSASLPRNLSIGMEGEDVRTLQKLLNGKGFTIAASGPGSPGAETTFFGEATRRAVMRYQVRYAPEILAPVGLTAPNGYVASLTRQRLLK